MLVVKDVEVAYGGIKALRGVSLEVNPGEAVAVIGSNGAGKSTLLKTISGALKPAAGVITFLGQNITPGAHRAVKLGIAHVPEGRKIFPNLTVLENLSIGAFLRSDTVDVKGDIEKVFEMFPRLRERQGQLGGLLSGGEQQMLAIGRGLMAKPKLLILDEPSLGLAPIIVNQIFANLKEIKESGTTILVVEQNARKALALADRAYVLASGEVVRSGPAQQLAADPTLSEAYLGGGGTAITG